MNEEENSLSPLDKDFTYLAQKFKNLSKMKIKQKNNNNYGETVKEKYEAKVSGEIDLESKNCPLHLAGE